MTHPLTKSRVQCFRVGCNKIGQRVVHSNETTRDYLRYCRQHYRYHSNKVKVTEDHRFTKAGYRKCSECKEEKFPEKAKEKVES